MREQQERRRPGRRPMPPEQRLMSLYVGVSGQAHVELMEMAERRDVAIADVVREAVMSYLAQQRGAGSTPREG